MVQFVGSIPEEEIVSAPNIKYYKSDNADKRPVVTQFPVGDPDYVECTKEEFETARDAWDAAHAG